MKSHPLEPVTTSTPFNAADFYDVLIAERQASLLKPMRISSRRALLTVIRELKRERAKVI